MFRYKNTLYTIYINLKYNNIQTFHILKSIKSEFGSLVNNIGLHNL